MVRLLVDSHTDRESVEEREREEERKRKSAPESASTVLLGAWRSGKVPLPVLHLELPLLKGRARERRLLHASLPPQSMTMDVDSESGVKRPYSRLWQTAVSADE